MMAENLTKYTNGDERPKPQPLSHPLSSVNAHAVHAEIQANKPGSGDAGPVITSMANPDEPDDDENSEEAQAPPHQGPEQRYVDAAPNVGAHPDHSGDALTKRLAIGADPQWSPQNLSY
jgi:hypothetical protein